jgi:hypothetical protein
MATLLFEIANTPTNTNPIYPSFICEACFSSNYELNRPLAHAECFRPSQYSHGGVTESCPLCRNLDTRMVFLRSFSYPKLLVSIPEILNLFLHRGPAQSYDYAQFDYNKTVLLISDLAADGYFTYLPESRASTLTHIQHVIMSKKEVLSLVDRIQLGVMNSIKLQETQTLSPTGMEVHYNAAVEEKYLDTRREFRSLYGFPSTRPLNSPGAAMSFCKSPGGPRA